MYCLLVGGMQSDCVRCSCSGGLTTTKKSASSPITYIEPVALTASDEAQAKLPNALQHHVLKLRQRMQKEFFIDYEEQVSTQQG